jgi:hypothetical protein
VEFKMFSIDDETCALTPLGQRPLPFDPALSAP